MSIITPNFSIHPDRVRNYRLLTQRWMRLVKGCPSLKCRFYGEAGGFPLLVVETIGSVAGAPSLYVSAGIHGDEPAGVEGLIQWAEDSLPLLTGWNFSFFPCLNPWGLERNIRTDAEGRDLNRCYHSRKVPQIAAQLAAMKGRRYDLAITLHEDFDARGFYLYEIASQRIHWGESLSESLSPSMAPDSRRSIDSSRAKNGVIRRRVKKGLLKAEPEAFRLHFHHAKRTFTFETPSEDFLELRIQLQKRFLELSINKLQSASATKNVLT